MNTFHKEMFEVKCSDCGKTENVPFYPVKGHPVYCRACYSKYAVKGSESIYRNSHSDIELAQTRRKVISRRGKKEQAGVVHSH